MSARHAVTRGSALGLGGAAVAAAALGRPARADAPLPLRVAYQPQAYAAQALYARDMGFFTKAGLDVDLQLVANGAAIAAAVAAGALDVGIAGVTTLAIAHAKKIPFVIVAPAAEFQASRPATGYLYVGNQTTIRSAKDMNGKVVGTPSLTAIGEFGVRWWVDQNGGDASTLKFQEMPFAQMIAAFTTGRIDAAFVGEPYLVEADQVARRLAREMDAIGNEFLITGWFATESWAKAHSDHVARFAAALRETSAWAAKNPQRCIDILAANFKLDPATISVDGLPVFPQQTTPAMLQTMIALTAKYAKFPPFPAAELIYT